MLFESAAHALEVYRPWPWRYFHPETDLRMACRKTGQLRIVPEFMELMDRLREAYGHPIRINSWYRSPDYNAQVSTTGRDGPHTTGAAVDIAANGSAALELVKQALLLGFTGVGIKQTGPHESRFVHLDNLENGMPGPRPWLWSYAA